MRLGMDVSQSEPSSVTLTPGPLPVKGEGVSCSASGRAGGPFQGRGGLQHSLLVEVTAHDLHAYG